MSIFNFIRIEDDAAADILKATKGRRALVHQTVSGTSARSEWAWVWSRADGKLDNKRTADRPHGAVQDEVLVHEHSTSIGSHRVTVWLPKEGTRDHFYWRDMHEQAAREGIDVLEIGGRQLRIIAHSGDIRDTDHAYAIKRVLGSDVLEAAEPGTTSIPNLPPAHATR